MVPAARILEKAIEIDADLIGLSGLITPSLDEMTHVASEMERQGFTIPLLIGGATTSRTHTAVKIAPAYSGPVVHVIDASRAVGVAGALVQPDRRDAFVAGIRDEYETVRRERAGIAGQGEAADRRRGARQPRADRLVRGDPAAARRSSGRGRSPTTRSPSWSTSSTGRRSSRPGRCAAPTRRSSTTRGWAPAARDLHRDALALLDRLVGEGRLTANAVVGFWPANTSTATTSRSGATTSARKPRAVFRTLRQQMAKPDGRPERRPRRLRRPGRDRASRTSSAPSRSRPGIGLDEIVAEFEAANDDYSAILAKALADRLAEAFAERLHQRVRRELWGYAPDEALTNTDLIAERYQGIRPAPGYPACPDHTEKGTLFDLLEAESRAGIRLTESFAMWPGAAVSGYYLWNPDSHYFGVGRIGRDQLADYAARKGVPLDEAERWLAPNLVDEEAGRMSRARARRGVRRLPGPPRRGRQGSRGRVAPHPGGRVGSERDRPPPHRGRARGLAGAPGAGSPRRTTRTGRGPSPGLAPGLDDASLLEVLTVSPRRRAKTVATVRALDDAGWARFGTHETYGRLDVAGLLRLAIDHDEEHTRDRSLSAG